MNHPAALPVLRLMVSIVNRGQGGRLLELFKAQDLHFHFITLGHGTASSEMLYYLGIGETDKDVLLSLVPREKTAELMNTMVSTLQLNRAGKGIAFTLPLSGINRPLLELSARHRQVGGDTGHSKEEETGMEQCQSTVKYDMVVAVTNQGFSNQVMDAAREAGAGGGTLLNARGLGYEDAENLFGIPLQPEKEVLMILTPREKKAAILEAINRAAGLKTEAKSILLSLPVEEIVGLQ